MTGARQIKLTMLPSHQCAYLPGRVARARGFLCQRMSPRAYRELMDAGFRRSGLLLYQPACEGCAQCRSLRVLVDRFVPSASQRRTWRRNADVVVRAAKAQATGEKFELYERYVRQWHGRDEDATPEAFVSFLYDSPLDTLEMEYRDGSGRLLAVGICDRVDVGLSSVYFYFDPRESRRGLGTFGALWEIEYARREQLPYYYLGYWVRECGAMEYKARFRPHEVLGPDGVWREVGGAEGG